MPIRLDIPVVAEVAGRQGHRRVAVAVQPGQRPVGLDDAAVEPRPVDADHRVLEQRLVTRLGRAEGRLALPALGQVGIGADEAAGRHGREPHLQDRAVGPRALEALDPRQGIAPFRPFLPRGRSVPELAAPGEVAPDLRVGDALVQDLLRQFEEVADTLVVDLHPAIGADHHEPLVHRLEGGAHHLAGLAQAPLGPGQLGHVQTDAEDRDEAPRIVVLADPVHRHHPHLAVGSKETGAVLVAAAQRPAAAREGLFDGVSDPLEIVRVIEADMGVERQRVEGAVAAEDPGDPVRPGDGPGGDIDPPMPEGGDALGHGVRRLDRAQACLPLHEACLRIPALGGLGLGREPGLVEPEMGLGDERQLMQGSQPLGGQVAPRLQVHQAERADDATRGRADRHPRVEAGMGIADDERVLDEALVPDQVGHDEALPALPPDRVIAEGDLAIDAVRRDAVAGPEAEAILVHEGDHRHRNREEFGGGAAQGVQVVLQAGLRRSGPIGCHGSTVAGRPRTGRCHRSISPQAPDRNAMPLRSTKCGGASQPKVKSASQNRRSTRVSPRTRRVSAYVRKPTIRGSDSTQISKRAFPERQGVAAGNVGNCLMNWLGADSRIARKPSNRRERSCRHPEHKRVNGPRPIRYRACP
ncbi:hypothetical protein CHKEEEPN_0938 [Methylorubrum podarium]|nr:hypothetical protein CHKEEEPN_0938 [Methylorubrum podarium]